MKAEKALVIVNEILSTDQKMRDLEKRRHASLVEFSDLGYRDRTLCLSADGGRILFVTVDRNGQPDEIAEFLLDEEPDAR